MRKLLLYSWPVLFGKVIMWPVYYIVYPTTFHRYGLVNGYVALSAFMFVISFVFILGFDRSKVDFLQVHEAKFAAKQFVMKLAHYLPFVHLATNNATVSKFSGRLVSLVIAWQFFPAYSVLSRRKGKGDKLNPEEVYVLIAVTLLSNIYWTIVAHAMIFSTSGLLNLWNSLD